jgi:hypothetical protein
MGQIAVENAKPKTRSAPTATQVPGSAFFALMAGLWGSFVTLLAVSPSTLDDAYEWLTGLPIVWEILMWIVTLPWTIAYLVYDASWEHWLRVLVVALVVLVHLGAAAPRMPAR